MNANPEVAATKGKFPRTTNCCCGYPRGHTVKVDVNGSLNFDNFELPSPKAKTAMA